MDLSVCPLCVVMTRPDQALQPPLYIPRPLMKSARAKIIAASI